MNTQKKSQQVETEGINTQFKKSITLNYTPFSSDEKYDFFGTGIFVENKTVSLVQFSKHNHITGWRDPKTLLDSNGSPNWYVIGPMLDLLEGQFFPHLSNAQANMLRFIFSRTIRWGKWEEEISMSQFYEGVRQDGSPDLYVRHHCGTKKTQVKETKKQLLAAGFIKLEHKFSKKYDNRVAEWFSLDFEVINEWLLNLNKKEDRGIMVLKEPKYKSNIKSERTLDHKQAIDRSETEQTKKNNGSVSDLALSSIYNNPVEEITIDNSSLPTVGRTKDSSLILKTKSGLPNRRTVPQTPPPPFPPGSSSIEFISTSQDLKTSQSSMPSLPLNERFSKLGISMPETQLSLLSSQQSPSFHNLANNPKFIKQSSKHDETLKEDIKKKLNANSLYKWWQVCIANSDRIITVNRSWSGKNFKQAKDFINNNTFNNGFTCFDFIEWAINHWLAVGELHLSKVNYYREKEGQPLLELSESPDFDELMRYKTSFLKAFDKHCIGKLTKHGIIARRMEMDNLPVSERKATLDKIIKEEILSEHKAKSYEAQLKDLEIHRAELERKEKVVKLRSLQVSEFNEKLNQREDALYRQKIDNNAQSFNPPIEQKLVIVRPTQTQVIEVKKDYFQELNPELQEIAKTLYENNKDWTTEEIIVTTILAFGIEEAKDRFKPLV